MSTGSFARSNSTRAVRKIETPRPLKVTAQNIETKSKPVLSPPPSQLAGDTVDSVIYLMDIVVNSILNKENIIKPESRALLTSNIVALCERLKVYGPKLETSMYQGQLDRAFLTFRDAMVRNCLEYEACVHLLEVVELRERGWITPYYSRSLTVTTADDQGDSMAYQQQFSPVLWTTEHLNVDEIVKRSGKYKERPLRVPAKNYCKDEIIIRNADSGKVMGIKGRRVHMIEQLSETIISFQKELTHYSGLQITRAEHNPVQSTAKERLVQITGPSEDNILHATHLIEETIRNNSSPCRELTESDDSEEFVEYTSPSGVKDETQNGMKYTWNPTDYQFKHNVTLNHSQLTVTGDSYNYVTVAKAVLDKYFSSLSEAEISCLDSSSDALEETIRRLNEIFRKDKKFAETNEPTLPKKDVDIPIQDLSSLSDALSTGTGGEDQSDIIEENDEETGNTNKTYVYTKEFLLSCRSNLLSEKEPENWSDVMQKFPNLVKPKMDTEIISIKSDDSEEAAKQQQLKIDPEIISIGSDDSEEATTQPT